VTINEHDVPLRVYLTYYKRTIHDVCHFGDMMGDVIFYFLSIEYGVHDTCGRTIDGMDKIYDGHVWCSI
jgi:hypothetical protein